MNKMSFTNAQEAAIYNDYEGTILVSASAGSGKTTAMIEKLVRYIVGEEARVVEGDVKRGDVSRLIILTFTKNAANDMRAKLQQELDKKMMETNDVEIRSHLQVQMEKMHLCKIGTIDSFCHTVYEQYFEKIGIPGDLEIYDKDEVEYLLDESISQSIDEHLYDERFGEMFLAFSEQRRFSNLERVVKQIIKTIELLPNKNIFTEYSIYNNFKTSPYVEGYVRGLFKEMLKFLSATFLKGSKYLSIEEKVFELKSKLEIWLKQKDVLDSYRDMRKASLLFLEYVKDCGIKESSDEVKKRGKMSEKLFDMDTIDDQNAKEKEMLIMLFEFSEICMKKFADEKQEQRIATFADIERFAYEILKKDNYEIAKSLSSKIDLICVDEYQDTNYLQEEIIKTFDVKKRFYVGDIKQSIYGFRHAEPDIFADKQGDFMSGIPIEKLEDIPKKELLEEYFSNFKDKNGAVVLFNDNFRSSKQIVDLINSIFSSNMREEFGKVDYEKTSMMKAKGKKYLTAIPPVIINRFETQGGGILKDEFLASEESRRPYSVLDSYKDLLQEKQDEENESAKSIANQVVAYVNLMHGEKIEDKHGKIREAKYEDMAILVSVKKSANSIIEKLKQHNIPCQIFFDKREENLDINLMVALLKLLDNPLQDIPLIQVALSYFGKFTEEELAIIKKANTEKVKYFHEAFFAYDQNDAIRIKLDRFKSFLDEYRKKAFVLSVADLLLAIVTDTGYDAWMIHDDVFRIGAFNTFILYMSQCKMWNSIPNFLESIKSIDLPKMLDRIINQEIHADAVRVMTIHGAKGLEFPIVILPDAGEGRAYVNRTKFEVNLKVGWGIDYREGSLKQKKNSVVRSVVERENRIKNYEEQMRKWYVALTRAQNHLFILANDKGKEIDLEERKSLEDLISSSMDSLKSLGDKVVIFDYELPDIRKSEKKKISVRSFIEQARLDCNKVKTSSFKYVGANTNNYKMKYSVTGISDGMSEPIFSDLKIEIDKGTAKEVGISYHKALELIDFKRRSKSEIKEQLESFSKSKLINLNLMDMDHFHKIVNLPIFDYAREGRVLKEQKFMLRSTIEEIFGEKGNLAKVTVQGVIDLIMFDANGAILVDYKYSAFPGETLIKQYSTQLNIYKLAIEKITNQKVEKAYILSLSNGELFEVD